VVFSGQIYKTETATKIPVTDIYWGYLLVCSIEVYSYGIDSTFLQLWILVRGMG